jgi:cysteinyl-tRNA synthetase
MAPVLRLYNTLTRTKEEFVPIDPSNVRMYVCGPTVYDYAHIGNARPVIVFDLLFRLLQHLAKQGVWDDGRGGKMKVTYVRNITDVDDKINERAARDYPGVPLNRAIREVTKKTEAQFHKDIAALGVLPPTVEPRATEHIDDMKALIERLVSNEHAYVREDHVLFRARSMPDYGKLGKRTLEEMEAGARVEVAPYKESPLDFVLWKPSKPGEPGWPSPVGIAVQGRPGWHIECSAMADKWLWTEARDNLSSVGVSHPHQFDIHGGGIDLVFPHHENEVAQTRCAFGTPAMAKYWIHNGFLQVEGEKMAKSLGNFVTINDLLRTSSFGGQKWHGEVLRIAMLQTHYTQPIDWSLPLLRQAEIRRRNWRDFAAERTTRKKNPILFREFMDAITDDLNTSLAFSILDRASKGEYGNDDDRFTVSWITKHIFGLRGRLSKVARQASQLELAAAQFRHFSPNEWRNILLTVNERPFFSSGNPKPETKLVAAITAIRELGREVLREISSTPAFGRLVERILNASRPTESRSDEWIQQRLEARTAARAQKNWAESDRIRDELKAKGIVLHDNKDGTTTWEVVR